MDVTRLGFNKFEGFEARVDGIDRHGWKFFGVEIRKNGWRKQDVGERKKLLKKKGSKVEDDLGRREDRDEVWKDKGVEKTERRHRVLKK